MNIVIFHIGHLRSVCLAVTAYLLALRPLYFLTHNKFKFNKTYDRVAILQLYFLL